MKQILAIIFTLSVPVLSWCQASHFVYLQTDQKQPFYVRLNDKIYSSSESGHLILGKLEDTTIQVVVGFPKNAYEEQQFTLSVKKDAGYLLKNFGDEGWGLFNLQTLKLVKNSNEPADKKVTAINGVKKTDGFSTLLANAVNDTAILYTVVRPPATVVKAADTSAKNVDIAKEIAKPDTVSTASNTSKDTLSEPTKISVVSATVPDIIKKDTNAIIKEDPAVVTNKNNKDSLVAPAPATIIPAPLPESIKKDKNPTIREEKTEPLLKPGKDSLTEFKIMPNKEPVLADKKKDSLPAVVTSPENRVIVSVTKAAEILTDTSYIAVFVDSLIENYDTIRVSIPFDESILLRRNNNAVVKGDNPLATKMEETGKTNNPSASKEEKPAIKKETPPAIPEPVRQPSSDEKLVTKNSEAVTPPSVTSEKRNADTLRPAVPVKKDIPPVVAVTDTSDNAMAKKKLFIPNTDCKVWASENDVDKLRIKMLAQKTEDDKLTVAKKVFKQRCFTTRHIKGLAELFTTEDGKYRWLDAAYPYVSDPSNFETAVELLSDDYFIRRFKAMLRNEP